MPLLHTGIHAVGLQCPETGEHVGNPRLLSCVTLSWVCDEHIKRPCHSHLLSSHKCFRREVFTYSSHLCSQAFQSCRAHRSITVPQPARVTTEKSLILTPTTRVRTAHRPPRPSRLTTPPPPPVAPQPTSLPPCPGMHKADPVSDWDMLVSLPRSHLFHLGPLCLVWSDRQWKGNLGKF